MPKKPRHLLMIGPVDGLDCSSRIIHMANAFSDAGTKVSLICPPQRSDNAQELKKLLHESTNVYYVLSSDDHLLHVRHVSGAGDGPEADRHALADFIDDSALQHRQRTLRAGVEAGGTKLQHEPTECVASKLALHVPPHLYEKYKDVMRLGWYSPFYFYIQALIIHRTIEPIDAIFCHDLWSLPVGCLMKELLDITLFYDSHEIGTTFAGNAAKREIALNNEKWMYELCDTFSTVSEPCADYYEQLCPSLRPQVITNAHRLLWDKPADLTSIKERLSLAADVPLAVYVGSLNAFSHVDRFIEAIALCRSNLHLAVVGDRGEIEQLRQLSKDLKLADTRVFFLGRVNYDSVFATIYGADFGIIPNIQDTVNPGWAILSSKLFDYAQVELPIISDEGPEIQKVFDRFAIGQTVNFQQAPAEIAKLLDDFLARIVAGDFPADERLRARKTFVWPKNVIDLILGQGKIVHVPIDNFTPLQKIRDVEIGERTYVCDFVNLYECRIGDDTKIGPFVEIQANASVGSRCKISSHSFICEGVSIGDEVFLGHGVVFTNELYDLTSTAADGDWITVEKGASIGSGAVITRGVTIGEKALVGAGAVVTTDVPAGATVVGNPSRLLASGR